MKGAFLRMYKLEVDRRPPTADMDPICAAMWETLEQINKVCENMVTIAIQVGDWWYNLGIAERMRRNYLKSAECQAKAAGYYALSSQPDKAWSSLFLVVVERATATVVEGDEDKIFEASSALIAFRDSVEYLFPGDKMPGWLKGNRQPHSLLMALWADTNYPAMSDDVELLAGSQKKNHFTALAEMLSRPDIVTAAEEMANQYWGFPSSSTGNAVLTALLVGARAAAEGGQTDKARELCERILSWTGNDGSAPMAIAKRMLAKLEV